MPSSRFIWYELATSDTDAAARFYSDVVGWSIQPGPPSAGPPGGDYRLWTMNGTPTGGLMAVPPEAEAAGMRPGWFAYVSVPDVDGSVAAIEAAGGRVFMPGSDVEGIGRIAMIADPQGAAIYLMTPLNPVESKVVSPTHPGHCGWNELRATDGEAAMAFYHAQFGWTEAGRMPMGAAMGDYIMFSTSGGPDGMAGGIMGGATTHPAWVYYINVPSIMSAKERLEAAGGTMVQQPEEVPGGSWCLRARDPQGALFALVGPKT